MKAELKSPVLLFLAVFALGSFMAPHAMSASHEEMNAANNPLTPSIGINLQDQYFGRYYDLDSEVDSNVFMARGAVPHKLFGHPQLLRATLPVVTTPDIEPENHETDVGDLNLFDIFLFRAGHVEFGFGPQLTAPTAGRDETGTGKWQGGLATMAVVPQKWGLLGGLVTWQRSFDGDEDRRDQDNLQAQPFFMRNFPNGWYFRSTATWTWDLKMDTYYIPIGAGMGKVWKVGTTTLNLFAEPQWTVAHEGEGMPKFGVYAGFNMQFAL